MTGNAENPCTLTSRLSELRSQPPRSLTAAELKRLHDLGFVALAHRLAAGTCPNCGMSRAGTGHKQMCVEPEQRRNPQPAPAPVLQPWEPRPSRRLRKAA